MSISGLVVHTRPEKSDAVKAAIASFPGTEVHADSGDGRLVVTVDVPNDREAADTLGKLGDIDGVLTTMLAYNYFDHEVSDQDPAEKEEAQ